LDQPSARNQLLLTKGDNNPVDDIDLYNGMSWLERRHIVGKVRGSDSSFLLSLYDNMLKMIYFRFLPYVGYITIAMVSTPSHHSSSQCAHLHRQNDFPQLKYALLGGLGLLALIQRE
jgi:signal peptidase